jgi:5,10-methenyltetrahydromethanopterin hydrogenase
MVPGFVIASVHSESDASSSSMDSPRHYIARVLGSSSEFRTSLDYTEKAFAMFSDKMTKDDIQKFARLLVQGALLENDDSLREGCLFIENIPEGQKALENAKLSQNLGELIELVHDYVMSLQKKESH